MYRSYLLKNGFWPKKKTNSEVFLKHDLKIGGIYAIIQKEGFNKRIKIVIRKSVYFFDNFDNLDAFLGQLHASQTEFMHIIKRKFVENKLGKLEL